MPASALRTLYSLLFYLFTPLVIIRLLWRGYRTPAYLHRWGERFGLAPFLAGKAVIWVHAVSVGEVQASVPLVRALLDRYPDHTLLLTTLTPTGSAQVQRQLGAQVAHCYLPYDLPDAIARFLQRVQPQFGVILETELWPNLLHQCQCRKIPIILANARLSERSALGYCRLGMLTRDMLSKLTFIAAQGKADANRFIALGAPPERVQVTGNLKFELKLPSHLPTQGMILRRQWGEQRPLWIAASTHEGEEEQVLAAFKQVQKRYPTALLVLVPRHSQRFNRVHHLCQRQGFITQRRSEQQACAPATEIFIGDSMGELPLFFAASDVAFLGGSLVPVGGHNPLEPAALKRPVILGPHIFNFMGISHQLLEAGAATQIQTIQDLTQAVLRYLDDPQLRTKAGKAGQQVIAQNQGASSKIIQQITILLSG
ncbi:Three-deoxy-D-manno-octulosonic-acid transferase-like protein [Nitrosococcus oceani ATCC 19707]|uniref:3-deoxy-D-manno-octulosonic acid transferase n=2 Tax=Nitrosococcus oceani TaxID=1229 RepID=Q3J7X8_NITOC|nr:lipid IV(A) 3-deoxy-D-manno-octulosonic acid transferase [Nitrosococcus oceani]ABA59068.1 Three-deoxy-D-manno-octulosonic-acid transferase-like protein [Nitrosococcus oceani ATCC 19707]EDZ65973.1 3-deoxy-D-manno-octulosonic-acid transferase subfamily, putative [Nitrosococcus oceani AFC27]KFI18493.1 3-deoxy-D-manno-octulosonic acid transferase [Nitrosococcus oceani C-27]GEM21170.1 3-deoxy-D-manno-octulosonic acid transferase [Nitrosococcus oceani]